MIRYRSKLPHAEPNINRMIRILSCLLVLLSVSSFFKTASAQERDSNQVVDPAYYRALTYRMVGPHRGGRVTAVAGVPGTLPTLYMGATGGGVWKSTNNGLSYQNVSDRFFDVGSIGAIEVAPSDSNVVYVGTGSACIRSNVSTGRGMYRSLDAGGSWMYIGLPEAGQIGDLAIHPEDSDLIYVAALGHPFGPNPERGVYRSYDGGANWDQVLTVSDSTGAVSISMNPQNPNEIYATMWRAERKPWTIISGGTEGGLYKTTDGGDTWAKLTEGLPTGLIGKIDVSVSPADPKRVYALVEAPDNEGGLYRSDDAGATFSQVNDEKSLTYRPFYYTHVHADPNNADVVYVSNESFYRSENGGTSFSRIATPHGDHHALWINPVNSDYLFQGNDGGATVSLDQGNSWSSIYNQATAELYHVVVDNQIPYRLYGEQQDNSTIMVPSLPPMASRPLDPRQHWAAIAGCETGPIAVHPDNPNIIYGGCKGRFSRYNHVTGQEKQYWVYPYFNYGHAASEMPFRFQRTAPIELSPHNPEVIYHGSQFVHKTTNEGVNWQTISPDLTAFEEGKQGYAGEPITRDITGEEIYSALYQIRESLHEEGVIWTGSNDGLLHITRDGGTTWQNVTPDSLRAGGRVQTIDPSPHDPGRAFVAIYRYMLDDWQPYIYRTNDYGENWDLLTDSTNGIPADHPTRVVREDPRQKGLLYAGTEFGLFVSFDDGAHWQSLQQNLPATPITDIQLHDDDLILSTMGRSFWIMDDITPLHQLSTAIEEDGAFLFDIADVYRLRWSASTRAFDGAVPEYPAFGAPIYYNLQQEPEDAITLEIRNASGETIRSFVSDSSATLQPDASNNMHQYFVSPTPEVTLSKERGLNKFTWDLAHTGAANFDAQSNGKGPLVAPGTYEAKITIGQWTSTRKFRVLADPRVVNDGVTQADFEAQELLTLSIRDLLSDLRHTVARIRALKIEMTERVNSNEVTENLAEAAATILADLDRLENELIQTQSGKVGAQLKPKLMRQLTYLNSMLTSGDQRPGEDAYNRFDDIKAQFDGYQQALSLLIEEQLQDFNERLNNAGMTPIAAPEG